MKEIRWQGAPTEPGRVFPGQFMDEEVLYLRHRHVVTLVKDLGIRGVMLLALIALPIIFKVLGNTKFSVGQTNPANLNFLNQVVGSIWFWLGFIVLFLILCGSFYAAVYNWQHDLYIITDQRVVDYNRFFPWRTSQTEAELDRIQDSQIRVNGFFANFFNYGSFNIETAGDVSPFSWNGIPSVDQAQRALRHAITQFKERKRQEEKEERRPRRRVVKSDEDIDDDYSDEDEGI